MDFDDKGFSEELIKFEQIIDKELSAAVKTTCMDLEKEMTPEGIARGVLTEDIGKFFAKEINAFVKQLSAKFDEEPFAQDVRDRFAEYMDYVAHKTIKKALNSFANRLKDHQKLIVALWTVAQFGKNSIPKPVED